MFDNDDKVLSCQVYMFPWKMFQEYNDKYFFSFIMFELVIRVVYV